MLWKQMEHLFFRSRKLGQLNWIHHKLNHLYSRINQMKSKRMINLSWENNRHQKVNQQKINLKNKQHQVLFSCFSLKLSSKEIWIPSKIRIHLLYLKFQGRKSSQRHIIMEGKHLYGMNSLNWTFKTLPKNLLSNAGMKTLYRMI